MNKKESNMDWLRLTKAIGILLGVIGIVIGVAWIINNDSTIFFVIAFIGCIVTLYIVLGGNK